MRVASVNTRRPYRSTIRRGDAPQAILTAAAKLFRTKGYLATSIDDIAAEAGVARPTVFAAVGPKPTLLKLVVDYATTGDDDRIPVVERTWSREALADSVAAVVEDVEDLGDVVHHGGHRI